MSIIRFGRKVAITLAFIGGLVNVTSNARAEHPTLKVTTRIQKVLLDIGFEPRVFSTVDARVYSVASEDAAILKKLNEAVESSQPIRLILVKDRVVDVRPISLEERADFSDAFVESAEDTVRTLTEPPSEVIPTDALMYQPSVLGSTAEAEQFFQRLDWNVNHKSQCYQRAHYWAYSMWNRASLKSMKVFLFFTRKYIRAYNYKWWFHVAPFVYAGGFEMVLDPEFVRHAMQIDRWSHVFVRARENCVAAATYREYEQGEYLHYCYFRKVPMYHYQPLDVKYSDRNNTERTNWVSWELRNSQCAKWRCSSPSVLSNENDLFLK